MMFIMKTEVLISLLCVILSVSAAAVVPVEDVVPEERAVSVPVVAGADVKEVSDDTVGISMEEPLKDNTPRNEVPLSFIRERLSSNCPQGWHPYQDNCYVLVNLTYSWINAAFLCESLASNLASAHSIWEYSFLQQLAGSSGYSTAWLGGYRFQDHWKWDDGTPFNYTNWDSHSSSYNSDCVYLNSQDSRGWTNQQCHLGHPFICSFKLNCKSPASV